MKSHATRDGSIVLAITPGAAGERPRRLIYGGWNRYLDRHRPQEAGRRPPYHNSVTLVPRLHCVRPIFPATVKQRCRYSSLKHLHTYRIEAFGIWGYTGISTAAIKVRTFTTKTARIQLKLNEAMAFYIAVSAFICDFLDSPLSSFLIFVVVVLYWTDE